MGNFKKIKFDLMEGDNFIGTYEEENKTLEEAIKVLSCKGVIKATFTRYTQKEAFKLGYMEVWEEE